MAKYIRPAEALTDIRILKALTEPLEAVKNRAKRLAALLRRNLPEGLSVSLVEGMSMAGGGSLPTREIPTFLVGVRAASLSASALEERLRRGEIPIIVRVADEMVLFDLRTIDPDEFPAIRDALQAILTGKEAR